MRIKTTTMLKDLLKRSLDHIEKVQGCCDCDHAAGDALEADIRTFLEMAPKDKYQTVLTQANLINLALKRLSS
jgi:hypothetical protein